MIPLLIYIIKASVYLAAFYAVYALLLSKDTMYGRNRFYVLLSIIFSLVLPIITIDTGRSLNLPVFGKVLSDIFIYGTKSKYLLAGQITSNVSFSELIIYVYLTGMVISGIKLVFDISELILLIVNGKNRKDHIIRFHGFNTSGFSAFGFVFVNEKLSDEEVKEIIKHEQNHINQFHSVDIIVIEIVKVIQWFNPFIYLFGRSLRAVHEYQADEGCLNTGYPLGSYQRLLLNQVFKSKIFTVSNSFSNPTLIKKRMIMMTKKRSKALANLKLLLVVPAIAAMMFFISSCSKNSKQADTEMIAPPPPPPPSATSSQETPYTEVDEMPVFNGGDAALLKYIAENTKYPESAKLEGKQGKVIVRFAVEKDGSVDRVSVLKGVDPALDVEAFRVTSSLPAFEKPGIKDGKAVPVWYMIPINFTLK
jgi:TonB family protein